MTSSFNSEIIITFYTNTSILLHCYGVMGTKANPSHAIIQYNSINTVTNGPKKFGCINRVAILSRVFYKRMYGGFCQVAKKKTILINEVAVRWGFNVLLFCTSPYCMPLLAQYYAIFELNLKILFFFQICG